MPATIVDKTACEQAGQGQQGGLLPISPFTALQFHFGMLLGVDDLETGQAYPRGKIRLHNAWLHREGVVWGFNVVFNAGNELTVAPGLALDAAGHELHLDRLACMDVGQWYDKHKSDADFTFADAAAPAPAGSTTFTAHVVARFNACLTRPVPSIVEPCAGVENDTSYSRVFETVELLLRPGLSTRKDPGYHRLRVLFQLEPDAATYADVKTKRDQIQALPIAQQPAAYLDALRAFAALDEIDLAPQAATDAVPGSIFPEDPTEIVLADFPNIVIAPGANGAASTIAMPLPVVDVTVRPSHIATATIQELLCGPLFGGAAPGPGPAPSPPSPALGPTVTGATLAAKSLSFTVSRALAGATLGPEAFSVTDYDDTDGWASIDIKAVALQGDGSIKVDFKESPAGAYVRFIARGTGPAPLLAADNYVPLGAPGAAGADDGIDFVKMFKRS
jgi:hypothetical protein